ncbi:MAG: hypothetical protein ACXU9X_00570 [Thermodesulfobacteriota bacterium]
MERIYRYENLHRTLFAKEEKFLPFAKPAYRQAGYCTGVYNRIRHSPIIMTK